MKRLRVEVTEEDIRRGRPGASYDCPLALAATRADGEHVWWFGDRRAGRDLAKSSPCVDQPPRVLRWRRRFDDEEAVKPFVFTIPIPEPS